MSPSLLAADRFGIAFGADVIVGPVSFALPMRGSTVLFGPAGGGKSTLLRTLAGLNDAQPSLRTFGSVSYHGRALGEGARPAMVQQHARLLTSSVRENLASALPDRGRLQRSGQDAKIERILESLSLADLLGFMDRSAFELERDTHRLLALARAALSGEPLVLVDEPTSGLDDGASDRVLASLKLLAAERSVLVTFHNRAHARLLGGACLLLAGGRIREARAAVDALLDAPETEDGRTFAATGGSARPRPSVQPDEIGDRAILPTPLPPRWRVSTGPGPRGFYWLLPGKLAGCPRPGVVDDLELDLRALSGLGITLLICLEEHPMPEGLLARFGIALEHVSIPDMKAPDENVARELCLRIDRAIEAGERVAVHCLAGLGRTGTVLAAYLVHRGATPLEALERVRALRPRSVQSEEQCAFITRFAQASAAKTVARPLMTTKERDI